MVRRIPYGLALVLWLLLSSSIFGQAYNSSDYTRNLFRKYLHREPSADELTQWVWSFQKGLSAADAQITFLASNEYFARFNNNSLSFISGLFTDVLGRLPSDQESLTWQQRYNVLGADRDRFVRELLVSAKQNAVEIVDVVEVVNIPSPPAVASTPTTVTQPYPGAATRESQLVATAGLLCTAIEDEMGGTQQGRELSVMARNLLNASRSLEKATEVAPKPYEQSPVYKQALNDASIALKAIDQEMATIHFAARGSVARLDRYKAIFATMYTDTTSNMALPGPPTTVAATSIGVAAYNQYLAVNSSLLAHTNQTIYSLRQSTTMDAATNKLLNDVEFFYSQANALQPKASPNMSRTDMRHEISRLQALSDGITNSIRSAGMVGQVAQQWEAVSEDMQKLSSMAALGTVPTFDPGQPVLIGLPTYYQVPYQVNRLAPAQTSSAAIAATDEAIAQVDAFVMGFNRFLPMSARVPSLQAQARGLRMLLVQLRQAIVDGAQQSEILARLDQINQSLVSLRSLWTLTVQERNLVGTPNLVGITASIHKLNEIYRRS